MPENNNEAKLDKIVDLSIFTDVEKMLAFAALGLGYLPALGIIVMHLIG